MSAQDNLNIITAGFAAVEAHDIERFLSYLDPDFKLQLIIKPMALHQQGSFNGKDGFRHYLNLLLTSFPDFRLEQIALRADGDTVYHEMVVRGTHQAALTLPNGIVVPATHTRVNLPIEAYYTFSPDGRFLSSTGYVNILDVIRQFGA